MAGRIPQQFIDDLINRVDIVEVIDSRVPLKKKGKEYTACCPFHGEKTPSFTVSQGKQFYHCFGCKAHGTAIGFLMEYEHLSFPEAIEELARSQGLEIPYEAGQRPEPSTNKKQTDLYELMQEADRFFQQQLRQHPQADKAVNYLKERGVSGEIAKDFAIGFAPDGWDNLIKALATNKERENALVTTGMLIKKEDGKCYDRFRDRIMFPIRDRRGRCIAFGGRILPDKSHENDDKKPAKYLNSPETPLFHKGNELYGLYEARQALRDIPRLMVVEGYMDVVALAQHDIRYAVATLGTATTPDHLQRLFQLTSEVVFCFDGDRAGKDAAWRALENSLPAIQDGREIRFLFLPEGEDPDSYVRNVGKEHFEKVIAQAQSFSDYFFQKLGKQADMNSIGGRAKLVKSARPLLEKMPDGVYRSMMFEQLATLSRTGVNLASPSPVAKRQFNQHRKGNDKAPLSPVRRALTLLLYMPELAQNWTDSSELTTLDLPGMNLLLGVLDMLKESPHLSASALIERWRDTPSGEHLLKLTTWQPDFDDKEGLLAEFLATMKALQTQGLELRYEALSAKSNQGSLSETEKSEFRALLQKMHNAQNAENN